MHRNSAHPLEVFLKFTADFWHFPFDLPFWNGQSLRSLAAKCTWIFSIHPDLFYPCGFSAACAVIPFLGEHQLNSQQQQEQSLQVDPSERILLSVSNGTRIWAALLQKSPFCWPWSSSIIQLHKRKVDLQLQKHVLQSLR